MLALTRRKGESIIISENIEVVVIGIVGEQVKLGVIAPKNIAVHRKEIFEQIQKENKLASESADKFSAIDLSGVKNLVKKQ